MRAAFAVMQLAAPDASLADFRKLVSTGRLNTATGAIIGLFDRRDYVHALFRARTEQPLGHPVRLKVCDITHGDSISTIVMLEMIDAIEEWAREIGCESISIEAGKTGKCHGLPLADVLVSRGFSGESLVLARRI